MKTRITELLGIEAPLILPGMSWISTPQLVAAVSNAGGLGTKVYHAAEIRGVTVRDEVYTLAGDITQILRASIKKPHRRSPGFWC